jgi:hypothetical protein
MRAGLPAWSSSEAVADGPFFGRVSLNPPRQVAPAGRPRKPPFMNGDPNRVEEATRAALPRDGRRDAWLEQRLGYLAGELARLKADPPLRRFLRGAVSAYRRFLFTADPAPRFHCRATIHAVEPRGWVNSSTGKQVVKSLDRHRTARTRDRHWRRA